MVSGKTAPAGSGSLLLKRLPCRYPLREPWQLRIHDFNKEIIPSPYIVALCTSNSGT